LKPNLLNQLTQFLPLVQNEHAGQHNVCVLARCLAGCL
jgi:hypothetical protein